MSLRALTKISDLAKISPRFKIPARFQHETDFELHHKTPLVKKSMPMPVALYGGRHAVTMIPGGGIGPEVMVYVKEIFKAAACPIDFEICEIDATAEDDAELEYAITSIRRNGVGIMGNIETKSKNPAVKLRNIAIRNELDLYAYVMCCKSYPCVRAKHENVDIVVIRQNTEGEYSMLEHESVSGVVESLKIITRSNSDRVARYTFDYARKHGRKKVTTVHKANIMKLADGLFLKTVKDVSKEYPDIKHDDMIVDNCTMQLVSKPQQFDIVLTTNLYGMVVSNVICGLTGGAGLISGKNDGDHFSIFEPGSRNMGTAIVGKNMANPVAMLNASADMLLHLGHDQHAKLIKDAINDTICEDKIHTYDLGGDAKSTDVVEHIIDHICSAKC